MRRNLTGLLGLFAWAAYGLLSAQPDAARPTAWDGAFTLDQAARGAEAFEKGCARCHSLASEGRSPLVGDRFWKSFSQKTAGDVVDYISANMPNGAPRSLAPETYRDIAAAMLRANGFPPGAVELGPATAAARILPRDGSTALPANALGRVIGCLARSGGEWVVTHATAPERAEQPRAAGEDAARALGTRTLPLKYVITRLDALEGARVAVNGLLIGNDGADGINVTSVSRLAPGCP